MALTIKERRGTFYIQGNINTSTASSFRTHFEHILNTYGNLTLDIDNVAEIDADGMIALRALYINAFIRKQDFSIVGYGCKEIYDDFRYFDAA
ncbi:hypothetical protein D7030_04365 [Flavobacteriaceae bacterium AU392]|nr:hypothetical protein D1817_10840 [Flavobacteriaceae bacterium]RKM85911.1 hypothetical protein D7030_04365 [Flavobacteriaceae bacterium AU392]